MGRHARTYALALATAFAWSAAGAQAEASYADLEPILQARCVMCHGGAAPSAGLSLADVDALLAGAARGPVVVPGDPDGSELVRRLRGASLPRMPLTGPPYLSDEEIDLFARWIAAGADPGSGVTDPSATPGADGGGPAAGADGASTAAAGSPATAAGPTPPGPITFAQVEPILVQNCARCHTATGIMGPAPEGYRLDTYAEVLRSDDRARVVPFAPDASGLVRRIRGEGLPRMPLGGPPWLDDAEIDLIVAWITDGPRDAVDAPAPIPVGAELRLHGTWRVDGTLDGLPLDLAGARVDDDARPGGYVQVRAALAADGRVVVERIRGR
jgi:mono/diheme cytochrome c family protein